MTKPASFCSIGRLPGARFMKPLAILLAILLLPPELPILGLFSFGSKAKAQITVCGNQASIFQVCTQASNAFEVEALSDYEKQYNLLPGDGNLIYKYGRTDLRMSFRSFMFDKFLAAVLGSSANRTGAEQGMISYFQGVVQQHEIAQYTAATADRDLFQQHLCQWVPDTDIEKAYGETIFTSPYCNFGGTVPLSGLFNGPPDLPTIDYFIAKGYKTAYQQPVEAAMAGTPSSLNLYPGGMVAAATVGQLQIAEIAAFSSVSAQSLGSIAAVMGIRSLRNSIFLTKSSEAVINAKAAGRIGGTFDTTKSIFNAASKAVRIFGAVSLSSRQLLLTLAAA